MTKKPTVADCEGCRDDFYNYNNMSLNMKDGKPRCWSLDDATFVKARDVPVDMRPPYLNIPITRRPSCFRQQRYTRVLPESLNVNGFWK